uniref:Salivary secreted protein n=2 Tax=Glossina TaxID=44049 RepID=A0A1B0FN11_GLOMM
MFKYLICFVMFVTMALARPGFLQTSPLITESSYHGLPAVHVVRPLVSTHSVLTTPLVSSTSLLHGTSLHGTYHGLY